ncbi:MAG: GNAT family N-acetyltransferase [Deltaproteobacteria bacterium]|nr:GNAT family N-acetyltransferase [Deltaproteobacteria bacterium]
MAKIPEDKKVTAREAIERIHPGMNIFIGTGVAEPRKLVKELMTADLPNLNDLELIQLFSVGDALNIAINSVSKKIRLKTFFSGWVAHQAITAGSIDLIPCHFSRIPKLISSGTLRIDAAFLQVSLPDSNGFVSLGVSADVAKQAIAVATFVVGEVNPNVPYTFGNTLLHVSEFNCFVESQEPLFYFPRFRTDEAFDQLAQNVASVINDGASLCMFTGSLYESLGKYLQSKKNLGVHTVVFTDVMMDLIKSGVITNKEKKFVNGKSLAVYAQGTPELMKWLNYNPLVEFHDLEHVANGINMANNSNAVAVLPVRKVDLTGLVALLDGTRNVTASVGQIEEISAGTHASRGGKIIFTLFSRNKLGQPNILISAEGFPNLFTNRESLDLIVTEYGIASMVGKTLRERAQALIDIAHPADREGLVKQAKEANIIYSNQIFLPEAGAFYPYHLQTHCQLKDGTTVTLRAIKSSDNEEMRRLFYRFSDNTVYYRYFSPVKVMPHDRMQQYVNIDYRKTLSIVAVIEVEGAEKLIGEGRYSRRNDLPDGADVAFVVDEDQQGKGLASIILAMLIKEAKSQGIKVLTADVIADNRSMIRVFEKTGLQLKSLLDSGSYAITIQLDSWRQ